MQTKTRAFRFRRRLAGAVAGTALACAATPVLAAEQAFPEECGAYQYLTASALYNLLGRNKMDFSAEMARAQANYFLGHTWCLAGEALVRVGQTIVRPNIPKDTKEMRLDFRGNLIEALAQEINTPEGELVFPSEEVIAVLRALLDAKFEIQPAQSQRGVSAAAAPAAATNGSRADQTQLDSQGLAQIAGRASDDDDDLRPAPKPEPKQARSACPGPEWRTDDQIRTSSDSDVRNSADAIIRGGLCYSVKPVKEHGKVWTFQTFANLAHPDGPVWYLPHDNENTAFKAAVYAVAAYGGKFLALHTKDQRNLKGTDPNRNFGLTLKEVAACKSISGRPTPEYTKEVMRAFKGRSEILTMHNNTNGGTVSAAHSDAKNTGMPAPKNSRRISDDMDDFIYVTGARPPSRPSEAKDDAIALRKAGVNVVYEFVTLRNTDCSLSNHAALNNKRYFNIEAQHGRLGPQKKMIDALMARLGYRKIGR